MTKEADQRRKEKLTRAAAQSDIPGSQGFPARLRERRKEKKLTMGKLARLCGITQPTITYYETAQSFPALPVAERLAGRLQVNAPWLAFGVGPKEISP